MKKEEASSGVKPFGLRDKFAYMFGDVGNGLMFGFASSYLIVFYTNVLGVSAAIAGVLFLVARFIDAFTDIGMGIIVDRTKPTKDGKFRPWIKRVCIFAVLGSFLLYQSGMAAAPMWLKIVYMFVTYILWGSFAYTAINIPYGSMASVVTNNPTERAELSTFRSVGSLGATILLGMFVSQVLYVEVDGQEVVSASAYVMVAAVISILALIFYLLCYAFSIERVKIEQVPKEKKKPMKESMMSLVKNKSMVALVIMTVFSLTSTFVGQSTSSYLFINWFNNNNALTVSYLLQLPLMIIMMFVVGAITDRFGKKEVGAIGYIVYGVVKVILGFMNISNPWTYLAIQFIGSIGLTYSNVTVWALVTDVLDDVEVRTGDSENGVVYGVFSFSRKAGQALGGGLGGFALSFVGYVEGASVQTAAVNLGIYKIACFLPGITMLIAGIVLLFFYPLSRDKVKENSLILAERKKAA